MKRVRDVPRFLEITTIDPSNDPSRGVLSISNEEETVETNGENEPAFLHGCDESALSFPFICVYAIYFFKIIYCYDNSFVC